MRGGVTSSTPGGVTGTTGGLSHGPQAIFKRRFPPLKRFSWLWRITATYFAFATWAVTIPWQLLRWLAPANLQDNLLDMERSFLNVATPVINFVQDTSFKFFHLADSMTDWFINTGTHFYQHNLKGLQHTFDQILGALEHRVSLLVDHGLAGIPQALSSSYTATSTTGGGPVGAGYGTHTGTHTGTVGERIGATAQKVTGGRVE